MRNQLFLHAARQFDQARVERLYATYWRPFDQTETAGFWKEAVVQGRLRNQRFELFLFHFLSSQLTRNDRDIQLPHLYRAFDEWWRQHEKTGLGVENALQTIQRYSHFYERLFVRFTALDPISVFGRRLRILEVSTIYPLLLFLFVERTADTRGHEAVIVRDLESYVVRRAICGLPSKGYNRTFLKMLGDLREQGTVTAQAIRAYLSGLTGPTAEWPDDQKLKQAWVYVDAYGKLRQNRVRMILEALEWAQYSRWQETPPPDLAAATVEHMLPQGWRTARAWALPRPAGASTEAQEAADALRDAALHRFGNLTLLTGALNAAQ